MNTPPGPPPEPSLKPSPEPSLAAGMRVKVLAGLSPSLGHPIGVVRAIGHKNVRVQLFYDASEHCIAPENLRVRPSLLEPLVLVSCGGSKLDQPALAGAMYVGSYHRAARRAASALTSPDRIWIVSARYGLLRLTDEIEPYEMTLGDAGCVNSGELRSQAARAHVLVAERVIVLAGQHYVALAGEVWPYLESPLSGTRGIGEQMARLKALAAGDTHPDPDG